MSKESISFRTPSEVKSMLQEKAEKQFISLSDLMNKMSVEYFPLVLTSERRRSVDRELSEMRRSFAQTKTELAFYEHSKLDYYFNKLQGKEIAGRTIRTKHDLFQVMLNQFDYYYEDDKIKLMDTSVEVKEGNKFAMWAGMLFVFFAAIIGLIFWNNRKRETYLGA